jgi:hypothetical protein
MLLLEHQEAQEHLANLHEKAKRISNYILAVSKWMEDRSHGYNPSGEDQVYLSELGRHVKVLSEPDVATAMNFEAIKSLAIEVNEARRRVQELSERKKLLGLK